MDDKIFKTSIGQVVAQNLSIGQHRKIEILEVALKILLEQGYEQLTFDKIAKATKRKRTLIHHYFKTKEEIVDLLIVHIRLHYQEYVVSHMKNSGAKTLFATLQSYIHYSLMWPVEYPKHFQIWLLFYYWCSTKDSSKKVNTDLVAVGYQRVLAILKEGLSKAEFAFADSAEILAKHIQLAITGGVVSLTTEFRDPKDQLRLIKQIEKVCLAMVQSK